MKIKVANENCKPYKKHYYDAGYDLKFNSTGALKMKSGNIYTISTGVFVEIPKGMVGIVVPRSSKGSEGFRLANTIGIIDSQYRGEIIIKAINFSTEPITIYPYERIAQLIILPIFIPELEYVDQLEVTDRGEGGFGSTGR